MVLSMGNVIWENIFKSDLSESSQTILALIIKLIVVELRWGFKHYKFL